jgi:ubiquinone/menaquinone biosynthesis C-methylase UbiE
VVLADLSTRLLEIARSKFESFGVTDAIEAIDQVDAQDLSRYLDESFDAVVAFGPFYHLLAIEERARATREITRVLRRGGVVFAAYVARADGSGSGTVCNAAHGDLWSAS